MEMQSIKSELAGLPAPEVLARAAALFPGKIALASSLGMEDQVLTDMIWRQRLDIPVFTLDTGRLFNETYELVERTQARYGIRIQVYFPETAAVEGMVAAHGPNLFLDSVENRRLCCGVRKLAPLRRALAGLDAWICGLRREQAASRAGLAVVEADAANGGISKVNPLIDWSEAQVREYVREHRVPCNPLHDRGFASIGCACCTRAVAPGEDPRSGRWWWEQGCHKECGLHR